MNQVLLQSLEFLKSAINGSHKRICFVEVLIDYFNRLAVSNRLVILVELFLIGLVVYWAVDFLEGTRGERLFRGVIFILVAGLVVLKMGVERYHFDRLEYLYKYFLVGVLIIAVAGFQPEIRRALIRLGQPRFWTGSSQRLSRTIEEIMTAVYQLSDEKTGAIIVIEKQVALGEFIETGVRIDARVTADLLKTIFYPGTPLHDMAVIIRGDRIVAARVQLPLAEVQGLSYEQLGSRHRAGIGISSGSDAICIVVSEESGIVSAAQGGGLTRNVSESELRRYLASSLGDAGIRFEWPVKRHKKASS